MEENTTEGLNCGSEEELTALEGDIEEVGLRIEWVSTPSFWDTPFGKALEE